MSTRMLMTGAPPVSVISCTTSADRRPTLVARCNGVCLWPSTSTRQIRASGGRYTDPTRSAPVDVRGHRQVPRARGGTPPAGRDRVFRFEGAGTQLVVE